MVRTLISTGVILLAASALFLASCSPAQPVAQPTVDANLVYTQAAQTVQAQMKANATSTVAPTNTVAPTKTVAASPTPKVTATATQAAGNGTPTATQTPAAAVPASTATAAGGAELPPAQTSGDKCDWVSQSPTDGTKIGKNSSWDMTILVKNSGTTTWNKSYALKFYAGDRLGSPADYFVQKDVKPGEMYKFAFAMSAPDSTGKKQANWVIQNADGRNFCPIFLQIEVTP